MDGLLSPFHALVALVALLASSAAFACALLMVAAERGGQAALFVLAGTSLLVWSAVRLTGAERA